MSDATHHSLIEDIQGIAFGVCMGPVGIQIMTLRACRDHRDSGFPSEVICDSLCGGIYGGQLWASRIL